MRMVDTIDVRHVLNAVALLLVVAIVVPFVVVGVPQLVGADHSFVVMSGSMQPSIAPGDVVIVSSVSPQDVAEGDVITFEDGRDLTTHQVVSIDTGDDGAPLFITKGTANEEADRRPVPASAVVGRVGLVIPWIGHVVLFAQTKLGALTLLGVPGVLIVVSELYDLVQARARSKEGDNR